MTGLPVVTDRFSAMPPARGSNRSESSAASFADAVASLLAPAPPLRDMPSASEGRRPADPRRDAIHAPGHPPLDRSRHDDTSERRTRNDDATSKPTHEDKPRRKTEPRHPSRRSQPEEQSPTGVAAGQANGAAGTSPTAFRTAASEAGSVDALDRSTPPAVASGPAEQEVDASNRAPTTDAGPTAHPLSAPGRAPEIGEARDSDSADGAALAAQLVAATDGSSKASSGGTGAAAPSDRGGGVHRAGGATFTVAEGAVAGTSAARDSAPRSVRGLSVVPEALRQAVDAGRSAEAESGDRKSADASSTSAPDAPISIDVDQPQPSTVPAHPAATPNAPRQGMEQGPNNQAPVGGPVISGTTTAAAVAPSTASDPRTELRPGKGVDGKAPLAEFAGVAPLMVASVAGTSATSSSSAPASPASQLAAPLVAVHRGGRDGSHSMTVTLTPDALGKVTVTVELRNGTMDVSLAGNGEQSREALRAALPELRRILDAAGVTTGSLDVRSDLGSNDGRGAQPGFRGSGDTPSGSGRDGSWPGGRDTPQLSDRPTSVAVSQPQSGSAIGRERGLDLHV